VGKSVLLVYLKNLCGPAPLRELPLFLFAIRNPRQPLRVLLLILHIRQSRDHDPLRLRRPGTVHRLGQVADRGRAHGQVLDEPEHPDPVLGRGSAPPLQVFFNPFSRVGPVQVLL